MAVTAHASGSQTAVIGTEHFLTSPAVVGTFQLVLDTVNMAAGDLLEIRIYQMVLTGGTQRVVFYAPVSGAQPTDDLIKLTIPVSNELTDTNSLRFSIKQTLGTGRSFPWKVLKFA